MLVFMKSIGTQAQSYLVPLPSYIEVYHHVIFPTEQLESTIAEQPKLASMQALNIAQYCLIVLIAGLEDTNNCEKSQHPRVNKLDVRAGSAPRYHPWIQLLYPPPLNLWCSNLYDLSCDWVTPNNPTAAIKIIIRQYQYTGPKLTLWQSDIQWKE